ncbi:crAss001_48 related protein [Xenorhabdus sp. BG5]|uniref:crAss001_48 related protein n=1 Tax=Xenorhabdus sp. BG5 TaxID=2782014 RepID=UPI0018826C5C|nr:hypothetical protein [Xenorhabdus sp. BG5]MBE8596841.1 hypothetical protein [Xenorhabdus sp. BG5]
MSNQQTLQPHQQRVIDELAELYGKIESLSSFIGDSSYRILDEIDRQLLDMQLSVMKSYSKILHTRVSRF